MKTKIEECRLKLRELQKMLFNDSIEMKELFSVTLEIENLLNDSSIEYNKLIKKK